MYVTVGNNAKQEKIKVVQFFFFYNLHIQNDRLVNNIDKDGYEIDDFKRKLI